MKKEPRKCKQKDCEDICLPGNFRSTEHPSEYCSRECYIKDLTEYSKGKTLKQFFVQKLFELGIIPSSVLFLIFIPKWVGTLVLKLIPGIANESIGKYGIGFLTLMIITAFIIGNLILARYIIEKRFIKENNLDVTKGSLL